MGGFLCGMALIDEMVDVDLYMIFARILKITVSKIIKLVDFPLQNCIRRFKIRVIIDTKWVNYLHFFSNNLFFCYEKYMLFYSSFLIVKNMSLPIKFKMNESLKPSISFIALLKTLHNISGFLSVKIEPIWEIVNFLSKTARLSL